MQPLRMEGAAVNLSFVTVGKLPDFLMTLGLTEIMHKMNIKIFYGNSKTVEIHSISQRSFHQCQQDLYRFINGRVGDQKISMDRFTPLTGDCRLKIDQCFFEISPMFPSRMRHRARTELLKIYTDNLMIYMKNQKLIL